MLTELSIKDFAIIDQLEVEFKTGLTVLTGETGAGKSIIIDAIQLLAGGRGSVEFVRYGAKKAILEGLFSIEDKHHPVYRVAGQFGIEINDQMIVLHRTISESGKSVCRINGHLVTLAILREFGRVLIDIHTQHETQSLMDQERHIELLDLYSEDELKEVQSDYHKVFHQWKKVQQRMRQLKDNEKEMIQRLDLLSFQLRELQDAELVPGEDIELEEERERLSHAEKIYDNIKEAHDALSLEHRANDWLTLAFSNIEHAAEFDQELKPVQINFSEAFYMVEDATHRLRDYLDQFEFDPERLNLIESRLNELNRLMRKYGVNVEEMLEYQASIEDEIDQINDRDMSLDKLSKESESLREDALAEARHIDELRRKAALTLSDQIKSELTDLYLDKAEFKVDVSLKKAEKSPVRINGTAVRLTENGFNDVQFLLTTNPGEPLKPLNKVASGGELSRIMLALKKIFSKHQGVTSVIFDEVDTGVSGRVAQAIAEKIASIGLGSQVLCISHLPQVAAMADRHLRIEKHVTDTHTSTSVVELESAEREEELARMMTGKEITDTSLEHAKSLITHANIFKGE
ncbi:DNA replication and repair protein RecN [Streptohalobacillus salinus]|uniref:DNA repair protein RecN n=1 Tax=Streptohalobacillus salinus TaxID=621096 RepID=A0A2V3WEX0_9BACI|nr:DNA repair protein RecN [Streptohalobacillus salinus]PXW91678.1 DNA replication and repair protein RecN [Streptohalobacillus salinus]